MIALCLVNSDYYRTKYDIAVIIKIISCMYIMKRYKIFVYLLTLKSILIHLNDTIDKILTHTFTYSNELSIKISRRH